ncbi:hypothetical protein GDO81_011397 [Engystomops pustulosus]|uniref:Uncharacterized protein n=1 Tax=Engystomops pustulosus TaxID=76066 RepID=A0AAV7BDT8_ENGPU|nr:hypothetical protein GDO81_011397 [Engystomops pustulosus]
MIVGIESLKVMLPPDVYSMFFQTHAAGRLPSHTLLFGLSYMQFNFLGKKSSENLSCAGINLNTDVVILSLLCDYVFHGRNFPFHSSYKNSTGI